jgi:hypothetical protein
MLPCIMPHPRLKSVHSIMDFMMLAPPLYHVLTPHSILPISMSLKMAEFHTYRFINAHSKLSPPEWVVINALFQSIPKTRPHPEVPFPPTSSKMPIIKPFIPLFRILPLSIISQFIISILLSTTVFFYHALLSSPCRFPPDYLFLICSK